MRKKIVVFADEHKKSIEALMVRLLMERDESIELHFISDLSYLSKFYESAPRIDVFVISENLFRKTQSINWSKARSVFVLTTTLHNEEVEESGGICLQRFDVDGSFKHIIEFSNIDAVDEEEEEEEPKDTRVVGICSSGYHVGKTTIAMALSTSLSREYKVLYIDAERIQTFIHMMKTRNYIPDAWITGITKNMDVQTLYDLYQKVIHEEEFDYLAPFENINIARKITLGFYRDVINIIKPLGIYDYIIVDTESLLGPNSSVVIETMDKIFYVVEGTKKFNHIDRVYFSSKTSMSPEHFTYVMNQPQQNFSEDETVMGKHMAKVNIPFDRKLHAGDFSEACKMDCFQTMMEQLKE